MSEYDLADMNTLEIDSLLCSHPVTRPFFRGTFPSDKLPRYLLPRPSILVVNSDKSGLPGEHWLGIVLPKSTSSVQCCEYFDSFGMRPYVSYFDSFVRRNADVCVYNDVAVQSPQSDSCGKFVCIFLLYRCMGFSFKDIKDLFVNDERLNEALVCRLFAHHFSGLSVPCNLGASSDRCVAVLGAL